MSDPSPKSGPVTRSASGGSSPSPAAAGVPAIPAPPLTEEQKQQEARDQSLRNDVKGMIMEQMNSMSLFLISSIRDQLKNEIAPLNSRLNELENLLAVQNLMKDSPTENKDDKPFVPTLPLNVPTGLSTDFKPPVFPSFKPLGVKEENDKEKPSSPAPGVPPQFPHVPSYAFTSIVDDMDRTVTRDLPDFKDPPPNVDELGREGHGKLDRYITDGIEDPLRSSVDYRIFLSPIEEIWAFFKKKNPRHVQANDLSAIADFIVTHGKRITSAILAKLPEEMNKECITWLKSSSESNYSTLFASIDDLKNATSAVFSSSHYEKDYFFPAAVIKHLRERSGVDANLRAQSRHADVFNFSFNRRNTVPHDLTEFQSRINSAISASKSANSGLAKDWNDQDKRELLISALSKDRKRFGFFLSMYSDRVLVKKDATVGTFPELCRSLEQSQAQFDQPSSTGTKKPTAKPSSGGVQSAVQPSGSNQQGNKLPSKTIYPRNSGSNQNQNQKQGKGKGKWNKKGKGGYRNNQNRNSGSPPNSSQSQPAESKASNSDSKSEYKPADDDEFLTFSVIDPRYLPIDSESDSDLNDLDPSAFHPHSGDSDSSSDSGSPAEGVEPSTPIRSAPSPGNSISDYGTQYVIVVEFNPTNSFNRPRLISRRAVRPRSQSIRGYRARIAARKRRKRFRMLRSRTPSTSSSIDCVLDPYEDFDLSALDLLSPHSPASWERNLDLSLLSLSVDQSEAAIVSPIDSESILPSDRLGRNTVLLDSGSSYNLAVGRDLMVQGSIRPIAPVSGTSYTGQSFSSTEAGALRLHDHAVVKNTLIVPRSRFNVLSVGAVTKERNRIVVFTQSNGLVIRISNLSESCQREILNKKNHELVFNRRGDVYTFEIPDVSIGPTVRPPTFYESKIPPAQPLNKPILKRRVSFSREVEAKEEAKEKERSKAPLIPRTGSSAPSSQPPVRPQSAAASSSAPAGSSEALQGSVLPSDLAPVASVSSSLLPTFPPPASARIPSPGILYDNFIQRSLSSDSDSGSPSSLSSFAILPAGSVDSGVVSPVTTRSQSTDSSFDESPQASPPLLLSSPFEPSSEPDSPEVISPSSEFDTSPSMVDVSIQANPQLESASWHVRLGHLSAANLIRVNEYYNLGISKKEILRSTKECGSCKAGKQRRTPMTHSERRRLLQPVVESKDSEAEPEPATAPVPSTHDELTIKRVSADLMGPMSFLFEGRSVVLPSIQGNNFVLVLRALLYDDGPTLIRAYSLKTKLASEVVPHIKAFIELLERQSQRVLLNFHCDGGSEFINAELKQFLSVKGIRHTWTPPNSPQLNETERENYTLQLMARCMTHECSASPYLWDLAVEYACYILERIPQDTLGFSSPVPALRSFFRVSPSLKLVHTFGSDCRYIDPSLQGSVGKFRPQGDIAIFVGVEPAQSCPRVLAVDPHSTRYLTISAIRDVSFYDGLFNNMEGIHSAIQHRAEWIAGKSPDYEYEVEKILDIDDEQKRALVRWKRFAVPSWEPLSNLGNCKELIKKYRESAKRLSSASPPVPRSQPPKTSRSSRSSASQPVSSVSSPSSPHISSSVGIEGISLLIANSIVASVNYDTYDAQGNFVPGSYNSAMQSEEAHLWSAACDAEFDGLDRLDTFEEMEFEDGMKLFTTRWVFKNKYDEQNVRTKEKARLAFRGDQQRDGIDYGETYSPTPKMKSFKMLLSAAAAGGWPIFQLDFENAFLHAPLEENIYIRIPQGYKVKGDFKNPVLKLKKSLYGLKQAPRYWYQSLNSFLLSQGFQTLPSDECVWYRSHEFVNGDSASIYLCTHVDDTSAFVPSSLIPEWEVLKAALKQNFRIKDLGEANWLLNLLITRDLEAHTLTLSQRAYVETVVTRFAEHTQSSRSPPSTPYKYDDLTVEPPNADVTPLNAEKHSLYRSIIGALLYAAGMTRFDIAHVVNVLCRFLAAPLAYHLEAAIHVLRYLSVRLDLPLTLGAASDSDVSAIDTSSPPLDVRIWSDSDYANERGGDDDTARRSTSGMVVTINGYPAWWSSRKQSLLSHSSTESELYAADDSAREGAYIRYVLRDLFNIDYVTTLMLDNDGAALVADHNTSHQRIKHIDIRQLYIRNEMKNGQLIVQLVDSAAQLADLFTKSFPTSKKQRFYQLCHLLGFDPTPREPP
jgi:hypothetical protein